MRATFRERLLELLEERDDFDFEYLEDFPDLLLLLLLDDFDLLLELDLLDDEDLPDFDFEDFFDEPDFFDDDWEVLALDFLAKASLESITPNETTRQRRM